MCDENAKRRIPFGFLDDIKQRFRSSYGERAQTAHAFAFNEEFSKVLSKQMEFYNSSQAGNIYHYYFYFLSYSYADSQLLIHLQYT